MKIGKSLIFIIVVMLFTTSVAFADVLKNGNRGEEVSRIQSQLKEKGYFTEEVTGYFETLPKKR